MAVAQPTVINVEVDYMVDSDHSHMPSQSEMDAVIQMFACQGITLNVDVDDALPHYDVLVRDPADSTIFWDYNGAPSSFGAIRDAYFDNGDGWHYVIFGHQYQTSDYTTTGSSGLGQNPGQFFVVTLGAFNGQVGTAWDRAATFAHELGHNLGLGHAGEMDPDVVGAYVPNVPSIMSYFYQLKGIRTAMQCYGLISEDSDETHFKELDYSHGRACDINETYLHETFGMGIIPVDWDCDGVIEQGYVSQDIGQQAGGWCGSDAPYHLLDDHNEWNNLVDIFALDRSERPVPTDISCITKEEMDAHRSQVSRFYDEEACNKAQATLTVESCENDYMFYLGSSGFEYETGSCSVPFKSASSANLYTDLGDIWYVGPGSYPDTSFVIDDPVLIVGPGGGVIGDN
jgi:hypothetical protein